MNLSNQNSQPPPGPPGPPGPPDKGPLPFQCPICKDRLKTAPQIHYGGSACFSCRAFFRRAHQKTKAPNFKCKNENNCIVNQKTRRKCQKCRHDICLQQGMKPEAVLTDDQKKIRFRNSLQKKSAGGIRSCGSSGADRSTLDSDEEDEDMTDINPGSNEAENENGYTSPRPSTSTAQMSTKRKTNGEPSPKKGKKVGDQPVFPSPSRGPFSAGSIGSAGSSGYGASIGSAPTPGYAGGSAATLGSAAATRGYAGSLDATPGYSGSSAATPGYAGSLDATPGSSAATPGYAGSLDATPGSSASAGSSGYAMDLDEEPETPVDSPGIINQLDPRLASEQIARSHATSSSNSMSSSNSSCDMTVTLKPKSPLAEALEGSRVIGEKLLKDIIMNFNLTSSQSSVDLDFIAELLAFHKGHQTLSRQRFCNHLRALATQLNHLALMSKEFINLHKSDQRKLLARNVPLYVQYVLARYINSDSGYEQISWLLGNHVPRMSNREKSKLKKISLKKLNQHMMLFHFGADIDIYENVAARLKLYNFDITYIGMWCHLCLFQNGPEFASMALRENDIVKMYCVDMLAVWSCFANAYQSPGNPPGTDLADETVVETMLFLCEQMARFFAQNINKWSYAEEGSISGTPIIHSPRSNSRKSPNNHGNSQNSSPEVSPTQGVDITPKYSAEEENWVQGQLKKFDECWKRVPMGEEILKDFIMFNYDVPVAKSFASKTLAVNQERYRLIMKMHSEFTSLDTDSQTNLIARNMFLGTAWSLIKLESCKNGQEQWDFENDGTYEMSDASISQIILKGKMKKVDLTIVNNLSGLFSPSEMSTYLRLTADLSDLINDEETFRLFTLVLLFSDVDDSGQLKVLQNSYLNVLRRRISHLVETKEEFKNDLALGNLMYCRFSTLMAGIKQMTTFVHKLFTQLQSPPGQKDIEITENGPGDGPGNGPGNDPGNGPGNSPGNGPGNSPGNGTGAHHSVSISEHNE